MLASCQRLLARENVYGEMERARGMGAELFLFSYRVIWKN